MPWKAKGGRRRATQKLPESSGVCRDDGHDKKRSRNPLLIERVAATTAYLEATIASRAVAASGTAVFGGANGELTPIAILAIERRDGGVAGFGGVHGDECEAAATAGIAIRDDLGPGNGAMGREKGSQAIVRDGPGQIADVKFQKNLDRTPGGARR